MSNIDFALFHTTYPYWLLFKCACVSSSLVSVIVIAMVVYVQGGQKYKNRGAVLMGYGQVCSGAFKYQHRLAKIA